MIKEEAKKIELRMHSQKEREQRKKQKIKNTIKSKLKEAIVKAESDTYLRNKISKFASYQYQLQTNSKT